MNPTKAITTISIAILGFTMTTSILTAEENKNDLMLEGYNSVATALYKDDLATAKKAAEGIVKHDKKSALVAPAKELTNAKTIEEARKSFNALSTAAIKMAKTEKGYKVAHCPMANGNKGGYWLQKDSDKKVNNPYFGAKMAHCGSFQN